MTNFQISIVSDTVCPWCYVGKKKLELGIAAYKAAHPGTSSTFSTTWLPFYLNPSAPTTSINKRAYYASKFGAERASQIFARLGSAGKEVGIAFSFGGKTGNTRDSHRLIQLAKTKGAEVQTRVVEELFEAYFEKEEDITSGQVLLARGERAGLGREEVRKWLEADGGGEEVDREVDEARERAVGGVPHFWVQGKYEISGAQDPEVFRDVFERIGE